MKLLKRIAVALLLLLMIVWCALSPRFNPGLYSREMFHPEWGIGDEADIKHLQSLPGREHHFGTRDGAMLHAWHAEVAGSKHVILFHHGNAGDIAKRAPVIELLLKTGASFFMYEARGFGESPGSVTPTSICEDGEAAYDELIRLGYKPESIVLYGESLGGSVATHVSTTRKVAGIITQGAFYSLEAIGKERIKLLRIYPSFMFGNPRMDNGAILKRKHPPLLLMHGEKDDLVPISHSERLYKEALQPKTFVRFPESGHVTIDGNDPVRFVKTIRDFLAGLP